MAARSSAKDKAAELAKLAGTDKSDPAVSTDTEAPASEVPAETPEQLADAAAADAPQADAEQSEAATTAEDASEAGSEDTSAPEEGESSSPVAVDFGGKVRARVVFGLYRATVNGRDLVAHRGDLVSGSKAFIDRGVKLGGLVKE